MKNLFYLLLFTGIFSFHSTFSQLSTTSFTNISTNQGLSQNHINRILKDHNGFMWFATDGGLNKYDGYAFKIYKKKVNKANSISNDFVNDIVEDSSGIFWIGTGSGLDRFDNKTERFTLFRPGKDIIVNSVLLHSKGDVWLGTSTGFFKFNKKSKTFTEYGFKTNTLNCLSNNHIYKLIEDNKGYIWIATTDGLNRFDPTNEQFTVFKNNIKSTNGLETSWIRSIFKDHTGVIWIGTIGSGIASFDSKTLQFNHFKNNPNNNNSLAHNDVLSFAEDDNNNLWIGTENGGISIFNRQMGRFTTIAKDPFNPKSLSNNSIYCLYKDDIGTMWVGTWSGGVNYLPKAANKFNSYTQLAGQSNSLSNSSTLSITGTGNSDIWIGTDGGGLNHFDISTNKFTHYIYTPGKSSPVKNNFIISVINAGEGKLVLGNHRGSFDIFDTRLKKVVKHISIINPSDKTFELSANCLFRDRNLNLWVGTWGGGIYLYDSNYTKIAMYNTNEHIKTSISSDFINCIMQDKQGNIWIGTTIGLNKFDLKSKTFKQYLHNTNKEKSLSHNEVNYILEDSKSNMWIATASGLDLYNESKDEFNSFTQENGLPTNMIMSVGEDQKGMLWVGTSNGIAAFNPTNHTSRNYSIEDGLQAREFTNNCVFKNKDGFMFFGGSNGFNYFHPDSLVDNNLIPAVFLTDFLIFNKSQQAGSKESVLKQNITETQSITISYKQSVVTFEFAALNYTLSEKNQYAYMLEGFDKSWNDAGYKRSATYTNLDPGSYTFKVKASNNDGVWNEKGTSMLLIIEPPFWKTWWFRSITGLLFLTLTFAFYRNRINRIKKQKIQLELQVKMQTEELFLINKEEKKARIEAEIARAEVDEANKKLLISNQEMEQFAYVASHDLREPLRTITSFIKLLQKKHESKLDDEANKFLYFITDASERMKVLIEDLLEFSRIGKQSKLVNIDCNEILTVVKNDLAAVITEKNVSISSTKLPIIKGYATEIKLLFQNLLTNAIKFQKPDKSPVILITATEQDSFWEFSFKDNGIGIAPEFSEKIFLIFQRLHARSAYEGSGIGLSHCAKIVALHHGKIWVKSTPDEGSTFYFTIDKKIKI